MNRLLRFLEKILGTPRICPHCKAPEAGYAGRIEDLDETLEPGLYVVCLRCAGLVLVGPGLEFLDPSREDLQRLWGSARSSIVRREQQAVRRKLDRDAARRKGGGPW